MIKTLREGDFNINFESSEFLEHLRTDHWKNIFEINSDYDLNYIDDIDNAEERVFKYSASGGLATSQSVTDRINRFELTLQPGTDPNVSEMYLGY
ncbi:hypothetical protein [Pedobacter hartonius]|uniref:Uncharacterized protein n=1 Tax=Pedobacter hartonius TaxID=425514 RepID=A0A1H4H8D3_9SPHI|nr:hypothetical protein [Pedobacter hartonius]SEB17901.1 hypothetical protein SAMN05443550_11433 [Pedobacter hartonius]